MKRLALVVLTLITLLVPAAALAQKKDKKEDSTTRSVQGAVTDGADSLINGAVVQLKDTKTLQVRSFITKDDGTFHFNGLNPNVDYELKAEFQGSSSSSKSLSSFDSRKQAIINLKVDAKK